MASDFETPGSPTPNSHGQVEIDDSPGDRIAAAVVRFGEKAVAERSASLLMGGNEGDEFLLVVGGRSDRDAQRMPRTHPTRT